MGYDRQTLNRQLKLARDVHTTGERWCETARRVSYTEAGAEFRDGLHLTFHGSYLELRDDLASAYPEPRQGQNHGGLLYPPSPRVIGAVRSLQGIIRTLASCFKGDRNHYAYNGSFTGPLDDLRISIETVAGVVRRWPTQNTFVPRYENQGNQRVLWYGNFKCRVFSRGGNEGAQFNAQERIVVRFHRAGWKETVKFPIGERDGLAQAVKDLNDKLEPGSPIRFIAPGKGSNAVGWCCTFLDDI